jgi:hypothetical protein
MVQSGSRENNAGFFYTPHHKHGALRFIFEKAFTTSAIITARMLDSQFSTAIPQSPLL